MIYVATSDYGRVEHKDTDAFEVKENGELWIRKEGQVVAIHAPGRWEFVVRVTD